MMSLTKPDRNRFHGPGRGFTLVELLVVMLIILLVSAAALPVVLPAVRQPQVGDGARIFQAAIGGARDAAISSNAPRGIRLLPDPVLTQPPLGHSVPVPVANGTVRVSDAGTRTWACNRFIPIQQGSDYKEGTVVFHTDLISTLTASGNFNQYQHSLVIFQSSVDSNNFPVSLTSWAWNIRVGDRFQVQNSGQIYTVIGPVGTANPNRFVNYVAPDGSSINPLPNDVTNNLPPEFLFLVNGVDDNGDGFIDGGFDGIDNNSNSSIDELSESDSTNSGETEIWLGAQIAQYQLEIKNRATTPPTAAVPYNYRIIRRPVPAPAARETLLPANVVIDLTSWNRTDGYPPERSRLPVDGVLPWLYPYDADSRSVDILIDPGGQIIPTTLFSSPSKYGNSPFFHFWLTDRQGVVEPLWGMGQDSYYNPVPNVNPSANATTPPQMYNLLPMPQSALNYPTAGPFLQGERMLMTIFTRTGNLSITSLQDFDANNLNAPYYTAQQGVKENP